MGPLGEAAGVYGDPDEWKDEDAPERTARIVQVATDFLRSGGVVSFRDFVAMGEFERACLAVAGDKLSARLAVQIARAARSESGELAVLAVIDGGEAAISAALSDLLNRAEL